MYIQGEGNGFQLFMVSGEILEAYVDPNYMANFGEYNLLQHITGIIKYIPAGRAII